MRRFGHWVENSLYNSRKLAQYIPLSLEVDSSASDPKDGDFMLTYLARGGQQRDPDDARAEVRRSALTQTTDHDCGPICAHAAMTVVKERNKSSADVPQSVNEVRKLMSAMWRTEPPVNLSPFFLPQEDVALGNTRNAPEPRTSVRRLSPATFVREQHFLRRDAQVTTVPNPLLESEAFSTGTLARKPWNGADPPVLGESERATASALCANSQAKQFLDVIMEQSGAYPRASPSELRAKWDEKDFQQSGGGTLSWSRLDLAGWTQLAKIADRKRQSNSSPG